MFSIYVHIPFCIKKCGYCDFFSVSIGRDEPPHEEYLAAIIRQLNEDISLYKFSGRKIGTIYFGGGTPSIMPPKFFNGIISALLKHFSIDDDAEISCEVNPATADNNWLTAACGAGVNRISIGVQSFNDRLLKMLGRIHSSKDAMKVIAEAQGAGFRSVSMDLMYAIMDEDAPELENDLRTAMIFQPEHISAYQLTIEKGTPMKKNIGDYGLDARRMTCPSGRRAHDARRIEDEQLKQMRIVARMLERGGWQRYEISNFAKKGFECRHNLNYWRYGDYLGLGAGATSFFKSQISNFKSAKRWTQVCDVKKYMESTQAEVEEIDTKTAMGEFCFMGLRTTEGISPIDFKNTFGVSFEEIYPNKCKELSKTGLINCAPDKISLTQRGVELSNRVFVQFITS